MDYVKTNFTDNRIHIILSLGKQINELYDFESLEHFVLCEAIRYHGLVYEYGLLTYFYTDF